MAQYSRIRAPLLFWICSSVLLLWALAGAWIYIRYFMVSPQEFAAAVEHGENTQPYADYVANIPAWSIAAAVIAAVARLLGVLCLFFRRSIAIAFFNIALVFVLVSMFRAFVLANAANVMSGWHIFAEILIIALSIYAVWFARWSRSQGILT